MSAIHRVTLVSRVSDEAVRSRGEEIEATLRRVDLLSSSLLTPPSLARDPVLSGSVV